MGYTISEEIKRKIQVIPKFKTDVYKIKSISAVKSIYSIGADETIIAYRVVPKLLAKIETGGTVFTDKGVYKRLPSGLLSSDYITYGIKYKDLVDYIPFLGYSAHEQPQLIGIYNDKRNLSFWLSPMLNNESNATIVNIFVSIIEELIQDDDKRASFEQTQKNMIKILSDYYIKDGTFSRTDEDVLRKLVKQKLFFNHLLDEAAYLIFVNRFADKEYEEAYSFVENNTDLMESSVFVDKIDPIIRNKIEKIGFPEAYDEVSALKLYCRKNPIYIQDAFKNIVSYHFRQGDNELIDDFIEKFENEELKEYMKKNLEEKIQEYFPIVVEDWKNNTSSYSDKSFIFYSMKKPSFYRVSGKELVSHYCELGQFDEAINALEVVKKAFDNQEFLEELKSYIEEYTLKYAAMQFDKGMKKIEEDLKEDAIPLIEDAVKYDPMNEVYSLKLLETKMGLAKYSSARNDINTAIKNKVVFKDDNIEKFHMLEVECAEGITQEMCAFYDLIKENNTDSLSRDSLSLSKKDQFGLSFYHYAIMLGKSKLVNNIDISGTSAYKSVQNYELLCFSAHKNVEYYELRNFDELRDMGTFINLLELYDGDTKKLYKSYQRRRVGNTIKNIGLGILESGLNSAISSASDNERKLRSMEHDARYNSHQDEIEGKRMQVADMNAQFRDAKTQLGSIKTTSGDDIDNDYAVQLVELSFDKIIYFTNLLDESVNNESLASKMVYLIIKKPEWLDEIFHGDRSNFAIHEEEGTFWYLPETFLKEASNLML